MVISLGLKAVSSKDECKKFHLQFSKEEYECEKVKHFSNFKMAFITNKTININNQYRLIVTSHKIQLMKFDLLEDPLDKDIKEVSRFVQTYNWGDQTSNYYFIHLQELVSLAETLQHGINSKNLVLLIEQFVYKFGKFQDLKAKSQSILVDLSLSNIFISKSYSVRFLCILQTFQVDKHLLKEQDQNEAFQKVIRTLMDLLYLRIQKEELKIKQTALNEILISLLGMNTTNHQEKKESI